MKRMLILARGDGRTFRDLAGNSLLAGIPVEIVLFVDRSNAPAFQGLEGDYIQETVRWNALEQVTARAIELHAQQPFTAIATLDEQLVDLAAELRVRLSLAGMRPAEAELFRNKVSMKKVAKAAGVRIPHFVSCAERAAVTELLRQYRTIVVKPVDGLGSRGVEFLQSAAELDAWYANCRDPAHYEAEEMIEGVVYHVNAVVRDGQSLLVASAPYLPGMGNIDFSRGTPFVSAMIVEGELKDRLEAFSSQVIAALGMRNGVTHLECFVKDDEEIVFCEIGARPGGGGIVWMIEAQYGINYNRALLLLEVGCGELLRIPQHSVSGIVGLAGFRSTQSGFVRRSATPDDFPEGWIHVSQIDISPGTFKPASAHCTDFLALFIFSAKDMVDFEQRRNVLSKRFYSTLEIQVV